MWDDNEERPTTPLLAYQREVVDFDPPFQLAIDGKSFAAMREGFKEDFQKVQHT